MTDQKRRPNAGETVGQLVSSAMKLSASVVQTVAEAATGKPQENRPGDTSLQSIIRHGTTAAGSIVSTVMSAARSNGATTDTAATPAKAPARAPRVTAGRALRIPLSVDNPQDTPMDAIEPRLVSTSDPMPLAVTFTPERLSIAPHDFEKLTVHVDAPEGTAAGVYTFAFTLTGQEDHPIPLSVEVV